MTTVSSPTKNTYLVNAQRPSWGKSEVSGIAVHRYRNGTWLCEQCGSSRGTSREDCIHVRVVKESL